MFLSEIVRIQKSVLAVVALIHELRNSVRGQFRMAIHILHLEDSPYDTELIEATLAESGIQFEINRVSTREGFQQAIQQYQYDLILSDHGLPAFDGDTALRMCQAICPETPFIFVTGSLGEERAIDTFKLGATDYVLKDRLSRLVPAVQRALQERAEREERKRAEMALRLSQRQIREQAALLDKAQDAIWVTDLQLELTYWNKAAEHILGWAAESRGKPLPDLLAYPAASLHLIHREVLETGDWLGELTLSSPGREQVIFQSRWTLVRNDAGTPSSILFINTDISEKKRLESQFLRAQRLESLGALAGGIAHDLNNVLSPILMCIELLRMKGLDEEAMRWLDTVETSAQRGAALIQQVLAFARGREGEHAELQVRHLILEIQKVLAQTLPRTIQITTDIPTDLWSIRGDATQLHQVLMNLAVNARDALPQGGQLRISAENLVVGHPFSSQNREAKPGSYILLTVSDTGTGIPPDVMPKIFDPFFTTKALDKGTGLGLATVQNIVKSHGGFITVESAIGTGTRFNVYFPALPSTFGAGLHQAPEELPRGHGECLLIVDDEAAVRQITKANLESYGYEVLTANDGAEGLATYVQHHDQIALVLTDVMMPFVDGPALIRALAQLNPAVKILILSGLAESPDLRDIDFRNIRILQKPFTAPELLRTVRAILVFETEHIAKATPVNAHSGEADGPAG